MGGRGRAPFLSLCRLDVVGPYICYVIVFFFICRKLLEASFLTLVVLPPEDEISVTFFCALEASTGAWQRVPERSPGPVHTRWANTSGLLRTAHDYACL